MVARNSRTEADRLPHPHIHIVRMTSSSSSTMMMSSSSNSSSSPLSSSTSFVSRWLALGGFRIRVRLNWYLLTSTLPIFLVLFWLPIQQELEDSLLGTRASLEDRVSVLAKHPDFVIHATSKGGAYRSALISHTNNAFWSASSPYYYPSSYGYSSSSSSSSSSSRGGGGREECLRLVPNKAARHNNATQSAARRHRLPRIKDIRIVGERNSGSQTLKEHLTKLVRNVTVESGVIRYGYWFQDPAHLYHQMSSTTTTATATSSSSSFSSALRLPKEEVLVIHVVTEPYEWFRRLKANPIHAPYHRRSSHINSNANSDWNSDSFFTRKWTLPYRPRWDETAPPSGHCQYRFPLNAVMPCSPGRYPGSRASKMYPVYEMNPETLDPFENVMRLRTAKLINGLNISTWMPNVIHVRSADVMSTRGLNSLLLDLVDRYRLGACEARSFAKPASWAEFPPLSAEHERLITCGLDWFVERQLGFAPSEDPRKECGRKALIGKGGPFDFGEQFEVNPGIVSHGGGNSVNGAAHHHSSSTSSSSTSSTSAGHEEKKKKSPSVLYRIFNNNNNNNIGVGSVGRRRR